MIPSLENGQPTHEPAEPLVVVRVAGLADVDRLVHFGAILSEQNRGEKPDLTLLRHGIEKILADPTAYHCQYYLALQASEIVGQLLANWVWIESADGWNLVLRRAYVAPPHRRRGIFRTMVTEVLAQVTSSRRIVQVEAQFLAGQWAARNVLESMGLRPRGDFLTAPFPLVPAK